MSYTSLKKCISDLEKKGELLKITRDMMHFDKMFITLPPEITKTHRARNVPLQPKALEIYLDTVTLTRLN